MPIKRIIKKTIKTIGRKKRGRPTDEDRRYEAISEDVEDAIFCILVYYKIFSFIFSTSYFLF